MNSVLITGASGLVGSALVEAFGKSGRYAVFAPSHCQLDVSDADAVCRYLIANRINYMVDCAAYVGGILTAGGNKYEMLMRNSSMNIAAIDAFRRACSAGYAKKFVFIGSMSAYPDGINRKISPDMLMCGNLERQNEGYALSKIVGVKMCKYLNDSERYKGKFISCMPANVYGPNDRFDSIRGHLIPAMIRKMYDAMETGKNMVEVIGDGTQVRSFIHSSDLASAILLLTEKYEDSDPVNIGSGEGITTRSVIREVAKRMQYSGDIKFAKTDKCGSASRVEDPSVIYGFGWRPKISFTDGIADTIKFFLEKMKNDKYTGR